MFSRFFLGMIFTLTVLISAPAQTSVQPPPSQSMTDEGAAINALFNQTKAAALAKEGTTVTQALSQKLPAYLEKQKAQANAAHVTPDTTSPSPLMDQLVITALREKVPAPVRAQFTLQPLVQRLLDLNLLKPEDLAKIRLDNIQVQGDAATGILHLAKNKTLPMTFVKEAGQWKIDLTTAFPYFELMLRFDGLMKGETPEQQIERYLKMIPAW